MRRTLIPLDISPEPPSLGAVVHSLHGLSMGTSWSLRVSASPGYPLDELRRGVQRCLDQVVAQMSTWDNNTDLCRFNRAPAGSWHSLPDEFNQVMALALAVARLSQGACDPSAGELVNLWGFGPGRSHRDPDFVPPSPQQIAQALARAGWQRLQHRPETRQLWQPGGLSLDLSAIAKGFGVDQVSRYLLGLGLHNHLVEVGGELCGRGSKPDGQPWWVGLAHPAPDSTAAQTSPLVVALHGLSVATSGDYLRCFEAGGRRYSHTLDPRSGWPIHNGLASVSVLHPSCMAADAWSTALGVMGLEKGMACAREQGLAALFICRQAHIPTPTATATPTRTATPSADPAEAEPRFDEHLSPALAAMLA